MAKLFLEDIKVLLQISPDTGGILGLRAANLVSFPALVGGLLAEIGHNALIGDHVSRVYQDAPDLLELTLYDLRETARRNFEPDGAAAALLFSRGAQAVIAHRVAHHLWQSEEQTLAMAVKSALGRALCTDIHPAVKIGRGLWLDHGLGCVIGETAVIGDDVSMWHNVTLGSTLTHSGPDRHPKIGDRAVIGAGATLLGNITIGSDANIAAGSIVLSDVPDATTFAGTKARIRGKAKVSFTATDP